MYKDINDYEQLYLVSENDDIAKERLFNKYKPIIISIAKKYINYSNNKFDMEDLIQEGYIGLNRAISSFNEHEGVLFYTFSVVCIERQIKSYYRSYCALKNYYLNNAYSLDLEIDNMLLSDIIKDPSISSNPVKSFDNTYLQDKLIEFKNNLDFRHSMVFELRYNGFKYREISELLDIPISIVDNCIHFCKEKLKIYMSNI